MVNNMATTTRHTNRRGSKKRPAPKLDGHALYDHVSNLILEKLDEGIVPWHQPWIAGVDAPRNLQSGHHYRGINALILALSPYSDPRWTTFAAMAKLGGKLKVIGEKANGRPEHEPSTPVVLWKRIRIKDKDHAPEEPDTKLVLFVRAFYVWNAEQIDWPDGVLAPYEPDKRPDDWDPDTEGERVIDTYLARGDAPSLKYGGSGAHYIPSKDHLQLPKRGKFWSAPGFYGTAFHEITHSTGHEKRLHRDLSGTFGSPQYAREELVAEISSAFLCATTGLEGNFDNSVAYIDNWMHAIASDPKLIVHAAAGAQRAADYVLGITWSEEAEPANSDSDAK